MACCGCAGAQGWFELGTLLQWGSGPGSIVSDSDGNVYAAGGMIDSPTLPSGKCYVAKFDNLTHLWSEVGTGSNRLKANGGISGMVMDKTGNIYVGGSFTDSTLLFLAIGHCYVAKWDGSAWSTLGTGANALNAGGTINTMVMDDSENIYVAGNFRNSLGQSYVAKWNGTSWSELYGLNANLFIYSICVDDSFNVYAAGDFSDASGHVYVARYDHITQTWSELGSGFDSGSHELAINSMFSDTANHVCIVLNSDFSTGYSNIFKWNGSDWQQLGALNGNGFTEAICKGDSGFVYAAGLFKNALGKSYVAKWDPQTNIWTELDGSSPVNANRALAGLYFDKRHHLYVAGESTDTALPHQHFFVAEYGFSTMDVPIASKSVSGFEVYPNPVNGRLTIVCTTALENGQGFYTIYNALGIVCAQGNVHSFGCESVDVNSLPMGMYFLKVNNQIFKITKK